MKKGSSKELLIDWLECRFSVWSFSESSVNECGLRFEDSVSGGAWDGIR